MVRMNRYNRLTGSIKCTKFDRVNKAKKPTKHDDDIDICLNCTKPECKTGYCEKLGTARERYYGLNKIKNTRCSI